MRGWLIVFALLFAVSCKETDEAMQKDEGGYFSIIQFAQDQWDTYHGQPFNLTKKVHFNGATDSSLVIATDMEWSPILKVFFETDISDPKFVGRYEFSSFIDRKTTTRNFYYEAKDKKLYTRKLNLMVDYFTDKIKSVYIEAEKDTRLGTKTVKLFYTPMETISIHEIETSKTGESKDLRVVYDFL